MVIHLQQIFLALFSPAGLGQRAKRATYLGLLLGFGLTSMTYASAASVPTDAMQGALQALGRALYFDTNLSLQRTQSCASCHSPDVGFVDPRDNGVGAAASLGDDGRSIGDRSAPSAAYAAFSPTFHRNAKGRYVGGQFWDGRAVDLQAQAEGPPLNPAEMGLKDKAMFRARILENPYYVRALGDLFGVEVLEDADQTFTNAISAIVAFEQSEFFAPFDSKYDRYLKGEYVMTEQEELGRTLFFSRQFTNCNLCHQLRERPGAAQETFSNYEFHNIGVPSNRALRAKNGLAADYQDEGLSLNPAVDSDLVRGKFKTPTLRNVAVTGPYMHNGVFRELSTVLRFYNQYNSRAVANQLNPETGKPWEAPEIPDTLSLVELQTGPALDEKRIQALLAFLRTLTDRRYEHLLETHKNNN